MGPWPIICLCHCNLSSHTCHTSYLQFQLQCPSNQMFRHLPYWMLMLFSFSFLFFSFEPTLPWRAPTYSCWYVATTSTSWMLNLMLYLNFLLLPPSLKKKNGPWLWINLIFAPVIGQCKCANTATKCSQVWQSGSNVRLRLQGIETRLLDCVPRMTLTTIFISLSLLFYIFILSRLALRCLHLTFTYYNWQLIYFY